MVWFSNHHFWVTPGEETRMHVSTDSWVGGAMRGWVHYYFCAKNTVDRNRITKSPKSWDMVNLCGNLWEFQGIPTSTLVWSSLKWGVPVGVPLLNVWEAPEWFQENMCRNPTHLASMGMPSCKVSVMIMRIVEDTRKDSGRRRGAQECLESKVLTFSRQKYHYRHV